MTESDLSDDSAAAKLDELDRAILTALQRNGRLSTRAIGRELGVAAGTVGQRIARLESTGIILGYTARVDPAKLGYELRVVVGLQINQGNELEQALNELAALPEVEEVLVVTGRWDLLVLGRAANPRQLNDLLRRGLWQSPSFRHSETMIVIDTRANTETLGR